MKSVAVIIAALAGLTIAAPAPDVAAADARDVRVRFFTRDHFDGREYTDEAAIGECRKYIKTVLHSSRNHDMSKTRCHRQCPPCGRRPHPGYQDRQRPC